MNYYKKTLIVLFILVNPVLALCQNEETTQYKYVLNCVTIQDENIINALDSCISILSECQFYRDGIETIVIVRPLKARNDFVSHMEFHIIPKSWNNMESTVDFCSSLQMPQPKLYKYKEIDFVFFLPVSGEQLEEINSYDTVYFPKSTLFYRYFRNDQKQNVFKKTIPTSKNTDIIEGYVFLYQNNSGEWIIKTINCTDIRYGQIIFDDGGTRVYSIP